MSHQSTSSPHQSGSPSSNGGSPSHADAADHTKTLYVLALEDDCYYVGITSNPESRIRAHFESDGAKWTQHHPPLYVALRCDSLSHPKPAERTLTLLLMDAVGWKSVRGASWTQVNRQHPPTPLENYNESNTDITYNNSTDDSLPVHSFGDD